MKKTYIAPTMTVVPMKMKQKLCMASIESNADLKFGGGTPDDFDEDKMR